MAADTSSIMAAVIYSAWPLPCSHPLGIAHDVHALYVYMHSRTGAQTCGCPLDSMYSTPYAKDNYEAILCLLFDRRVHKNGTEPAQVCMCL